MPVLRLAYATQFLIAIATVFLVWGQVGGQTHLDAIPWYLKLCAGTGAAYAIVRATAAAVSRDSVWNGGTLRWGGILIALLIGCGLLSYYSHLYWEPADQPQDDSQDAGQIGELRMPTLPFPGATLRP
jgi:hypothetical protein